MSELLLYDKFKGPQPSRLQPNRSKLERIGRVNVILPREEGMSTNPSQRYHIYVDEDKNVWAKPVEDEDG